MRTVKVVKLEDFIKEAESLYGKDAKKWKFICPVCDKDGKGNPIIENGEYQGINTPEFKVKLKELVAAG